MATQWIYKAIVLALAGIYHGFKKYNSLLIQPNRQMYVFLMLRQMQQPNIW